MNSIDQIVPLLEEIRDLLKDLNKPRPRGHSVKAAPTMSQEDLEELDDEINLDWWYLRYGEDPYPAKYMNPNFYPSYSPEEADYLSNRLKEVASMNPTVNEGTHIFSYVGKKYCKGEKNTYYCFACVPVEK